MTLGMVMEISDNYYTATIWWTAMTFGTNQSYYICLFTCFYNTNTLIKWKIWKPSTFHTPKRCIPRGTNHAVPFPGLFVYFGYGIWHSKEGMRELQPKDMAARYVVLPSGSLVETVQSVQPDGQVDHISPSTAPTAEENAGQRWCVTKTPTLLLPGIIRCFPLMRCTITSVRSVSHPF